MAQFDLHPNVNIPGKGDGIHRSVCRVCHGGCGALVEVKDGRVVKVSPDPESPLSRGWMCPKGINSPAIANHPDRLKHPLKRKGRRGSGEWERIAWEQALDEIATKLDELRRVSGPESIALGQGTGRHHYMRVVRFANQLGTPNWYEPGLANCLFPRITVSFITYGGFVTADYYGEVSPKCILFWGHNPLTSSPDGELGIAAKRALQEGAVGIAIDPRRSETAKLCARWLALRPGTDAALAMAMIHVIIEEELYDKDFVTKWTVGFDELKQKLKLFGPQWAQEICGVEATEIRDAARLYARTKPAILEWGCAIEHSPNSLQTVRAIAILRAITGNLDVPGGDIVGMSILRGYPTLRNHISSDMNKKRLGADQFKLLSGQEAFIPSAHIPALLNAMRTGTPYRVRALMLFGGNPLSTVAETKLVHESLSALDLLVATDLFMTPTAVLADYVLPAAFWTEMEQIAAYPLVAENMVFAQPKLVQMAECRQDEWIMDELSRRLGLPDCNRCTRELMDYQLAPLGLTYEELEAKNWIFPAHRYLKHTSEGFRTPSGKIELYSKTLERMGYEPLPSYREPPESPLSCRELTTTFPYVLTTGARRRGFFHSEHRQIPELRRIQPNPLAEIHPDTASKHGINDGDWVLVTTLRGTIRMKALVSKDIKSDVVSVDHGWWFPERKGPDFGIWESNANVLTSSQPPYDPAFGTYQLRALLCRIDRED